MSLCQSGGDVLMAFELALRSNNEYRHSYMPNVRQYSKTPSQPAGKPALLTHLQGLFPLVIAT